MCLEDIIEEKIKKYPTKPSKQHFTILKKTIKQHYLTTHKSSTPFKKICYSSDIFI